VTDAAPSFFLGPGWGWARAEQSCLSHFWCEWLSQPPGALWTARPCVSSTAGDGCHSCPCLVLGSFPCLLGGANFPESSQPGEGHVNPTTCPQALAMNPDFQVLPITLNTWTWQSLYRVSDGGDTVTLCDVMVTILTVSRPHLKKQKMMEENGVWHLFV
jgi:hypothetical protein